MEIKKAERAFLSTLIFPQNENFSFCFSLLFIRPALTKSFFNNSQFNCQTIIPKIKLIISFF